MLVFTRFLHQPKYAEASHLTTFLSLSCCVFVMFITTHTIALPLQVKASGKHGKMRNFKDSGLKNGLFLLELISAIEPRAVDWDVVKT